MPETDVLQILLAHDHWATMQLLNACSNLSADQFNQRFDIGPGSLHDTITHMISAILTWNDTLAVREHRPRPDQDGQRRTIEQLRPMFETVWTELTAEVGRRPLDEIVTRVLRSGRTVHLPRAAVLAHVTTHDMHHRAQCLNMLRQLGITPLPPSSVAEWMMRDQGR